MTELSLFDAQTLSDPYWRPRLADRARAEYIAADQSLPGVSEAFQFLISQVPAADGIEALQALRRVVRVMQALHRLTAEQKDILRHHHIDPNGPYGARISKRPQDLILILAEARRDVWMSSPELAGVRNGMDAEQGRRQEAERARRETEVAAIASAQIEAAEAPSRVLAWHDAGLRIDVAANGRARVWPASRLQAEDAAYLEKHNAAVAAAVQVEWSA